MKTAKQFSEEMRQIREEMINSITKRMDGVDNLRFADEVKFSGISRNSSGGIVVGYLELVQNEFECGEYKETRVALNRMNASDLLAVLFQIEQTEQA